MSQYGFLCAVLALKGIQRADVLAALERTVTEQEVTLGQFVVSWDGEEPGTYTLELHDDDGNAIVSIWQNDREEFKCDILDVVFFSNPAHRDPGTDSMFWRRDYDARVYQIFAPDEAAETDDRNDSEIEQQALLTCIANLAVLHAPSDQEWDGKITVSPGPRGSDDEEPQSSGDTTPTGG